MFGFSICNSFRPETPYVAQSGFTLRTLLPKLPQCWVYRHSPPLLASFIDSNERLDHVCISFFFFFWDNMSVCIQASLALAVNLWIYKQVVFVSALLGITEMHHHTWFSLYFLYCLLLGNKSLLLIWGLSVKLDYSVLGTVDLKYSYELVGQL